MRAISGVLLGYALILASVGVAMGQGGDASASGTASSTTRSQGAVEIPGPIDAQGTMQSATKAEADASADAGMKADADAKAKAILNTIRERAKNASTKARAKVEKELAEISSQIDAEANGKGDIIVAGRIAPEFGMTGEAMIAEQSKFDTGLGELMIAHTLMANSRTAVTVEQLFLLQREGFGWGQIAHGLNLRLGEVVAAVKSEGNVAAGRAKADGRPAMIHSGTHVNAGTKAGVRAGPATAGAASSVGAGVKVGK
ncbi:MAG TPA: hypothetical protein VGJ98_03810 [Candidatus Eisenbacteria bacterium]